MTDALTVESDQHLKSYGKIFGPLGRGTTPIAEIKDKLRDDKTKAYVKGTAFLDGGELSRTPIPERKVNP